MGFRVLGLGIVCLAFMVYDGLGFGALEFGV